MDFPAIAVVGRGIAWKSFAVADHFAGAFFKLNLPAAGMIDSFESESANSVYRHRCTFLPHLVIVNHTPGSYLQGDLRSTSPTSLEVMYESA